MLEKIKNNFNKIVFVLSIIAIGLLVPTLFSCFFKEFTEQNIINLIRYSLFIVVDVLLLVFSLKKENKGKSLYILAFVFYFANLIFLDTYSVIKNKTYESIPYIALYIAIIVLFILAQQNNPKVLFAFQILLALVCVMNFVRVLASSSYFTSLWITSLVFVVNTILPPATTKEEEL